ncbi:hypothetical protein AB0F17_66135 [Nonomuraea sp. NPDC026600]|uniref:hypothetical protein n=1 Tax=Nonomuraea sp. NPDC026600 TaxID=3155363 RepID=UPI0033F3A958
MEWIIIGLTLLALYVFWDRSRHSKKYCSRCKGSGRRTSWINGRAYGECRRCSGKGSLRR